ncbi:hypothetical protein GGP65_003155 [Salinibacter ruber]|nr:hypothetical protein [Salinibacter ruber]
MLRQNSFSGTGEKELWTMMVTLHQQWSTNSREPAVEM